MTARRVPQEVIDRIKREVSLVALAESQGHTLKKQGKDFAVCCPFHEEDTPSCIISPDSNLFNCFGCGASGSVIDWAMKTKGLSFRFACELLANDASLVADGDANVKRQTKTRMHSSLAADSDNQTLTQQVIDFYHTTLKQSPEVLAYLQRRGLEHPELIDTFKLGFANRTLGYRLPEKNRKAGKELRTQLQQIGLYRESGHEHFNGCLVVPVINEQGLVTEIYGRKVLGKQLKKNLAQHLYLPGPHEGVWNEAALVNQQEVILCESVIDAMTFWVNGFRNVTTSYGTQGFTASHLVAFKQHNIQRVLIAYDNDDAGNRAAAELSEKLMTEGFATFRINFPKNMDANEFAVHGRTNAAGAGSPVAAATSVTPAKKSLELVIRKADWLGNGKAPKISTSQQEASPLAAVINEVDNEVAIAEAEPEKVELTDIDVAAQPRLPQSQLTFEERNGALYASLGERHYRLRGWEANSSNLLQLKVQLLAQRGDHFHMDKLDLTSHKQRQVFINQASVELGVTDEVLKTDLGQLLLALENKLTPVDEPQQANPNELTTEARQAALSLLRKNDLLNTILDDFAKAGVVGEESNKLVGYLAATSRKLSKPLAIMIQSSSAAGKSSLMDAVLAMMPTEETIQYSAMTGQSLFYMGETNLKHKILAISEEEGASNASYALKLLQSEGQVTIASTGKDDSSGDLVTKEYTVEGPVMLCFTTTAIDNDEELVNRCLVLSVNEGREQTQAIHAQQRKKRTLAGLEDQLHKQAILQTHQDAQRLLKPLKVINPFAEQLTFLSDKTRTRRDHEKYLTLIDSIALLHQYQRHIQTVEHNGQAVEYIEVTLEDIEQANRLAHEVLGRTLDELPAQTRKLLTLISDWAKEHCDQQQLPLKDFHFSRRQVRQLCGWSETQVRVHMQRLVAMEYLLIHKGGRGKSFVYELLYQDEGQQGDAFMLGLFDVEQLKHTVAAPVLPCTSYDPNLADSEANLAGSSRPLRGGVAESPTSPQPVNGQALAETSRSNNQDAVPVV